MGRGIGDVLAFAIGVAISPVPIIALILMLFSRRAWVNGPMFLLAWVLALAVVSGVAYAIADQSNPSTSSSAADTISWGEIVLGVLFLPLALRQWRNRPAADTEPKMPKWMASVDALSPGKSPRPRSAAGRREPEEPDPDTRHCRDSRRSGSPRATPSCR